MTTSTAKRRLWRGVVSLFAGVLHLMFQQAGQILLGHDLLASLRTRYPNDLLSYLSIVTNVKFGDTASVEPFTQTGVSHYPMDYYAAVGEVARLFGVSSLVSWNLVGLVVQSLAVTVLAAVLIGISDRWWVGLLAPLPFLTGTLAYLTSDNWFSLLDEHAVLWGPFAVLYPRNAESAGLCVVFALAVVIVWLWCTRHPMWVRWTVSVLSGLAVGGLAGFQTYSFLIGIYLFSYVLAAVMVAKSGRWLLWTGASVALVALVWWLGPAVASAYGQLPTLVFGLLPAGPGLVLATIHTRGLIAGPGVAALLGASPQMLFTWAGLAAGDPFLLYRVDSNVGLGVVGSTTLVSSIPVLLGLIGVVVVAVLLGKRLVVGLAAGVLVTWVVTALNDVWGANAEPYRFWIDGYLLGAVAVLLCWVVLLATPGRVEHRRNPSQRRGIAVLAVIAMTGLVWAVALPDWINYTGDADAQRVWSPGTSRELAAAAVVATVGANSRELVITDKCMDPRTLKITTGTNVAYYNLGLAWPERRDAIDKARYTIVRDGALDFGVLSEAKIGWLIEDSACAYNWGKQYPTRLELVAQRAYQVQFGEESVAGDQVGAVDESGQRSGTIRLWRVRPL